MATSIPVTPVHWRPAHRIVPSRFPPVGLWDRIADPSDFDALAQIESLTNPRVRDELGLVDLIPRDRRVAGPGTTPIMAAFTHFNPAGSRFSDGTYGVFYAAHALATAIAETRYHSARFLAATNEPALEVTMRCYTMTIRARLHELRDRPDMHDPDSYAASQKVGGALREAGSNGIVYRSVRDASGECVALFWPDQVGPCTQTQHFGYVWDGQRITHVVRKTLVD